MFIKQYVDEEIYHRILCYITGIRIYLLFLYQGKIMFILYCWKLKLKIEILNRPG